MKHAGPAALATVEPLLAELRARTVLKERKPGIFYLKAQSFLHFHEDAAGIFADVKLDRAQFTRLPVNSAAEHQALLDQVDTCLGRTASAT